MDRSRRICLLGFPGSIVLFVIPATILYDAHYLFVPFYVSRTGSPYLVGYLIARSATMALFLVTAAVGLSDYSCWLPWKAKERKIQNWCDLQLTKAEVLGVIIGISLILIGAYNETLIATLVVLSPSN